MYIVGGTGSKTIAEDLSKKLGCPLAKTAVRRFPDRELYVRILDDWLKAIENERKPLLHAKVAANFCMSGIQASRSARDGGKPKEIKIYTD